MCIRDRLKSQGYLKYYKQRDKRQKPADFLRFTSTDGLEIRVGRNNAQNCLLYTSDKWFVYALAKTHYKALLSSGVKISEWQPGFTRCV